MVLADEGQYQLLSGGAQCIRIGAPLWLGSAVGLGAASCGTSMEALGQAFEFGWFILTYPWLSPPPADVLATPSLIPVPHSYPFYLSVGIAVSAAVLMEVYLAHLTMINPDWHSNS